MVPVACLILTAGCTETQNFRPYVPELKKIRLENFIPGVKFQQKFPDKECETTKRSALDKQLDKGVGAPEPGIGAVTRRLDFASKTSDLPKWDTEFAKSAVSHGYTKQTPTDTVNYGGSEFKKPASGREPEIFVRLVWLKGNSQRTNAYVELYVSCANLLR
jgi:hypothetical protein